jgi:hypothetical protein
MDQNKETDVARELGKWRDQASFERTMKRQACWEVAELKARLQESQRDNKKLEEHIQ